MFQEDRDHVKAKLDEVTTAISELQALLKQSTEGIILFFVCRCGALVSVLDLYNQSLIIVCLSSNTHVATTIDNNALEFINKKM